MLFISSFHTKFNSLSFVSILNLISAFRPLNIFNTVVIVIFRDPLSSFDISDLFTNKTL